MPVYEYECTHCGATFELLRKVSGKAPRRCPECGEPGGVTKKVSAPSFQFKGSGWYVTDYAGKGGKKTDGDDKPASESSSASESKSDAKDAKDSKDSKDAKDSRPTNESKSTATDSKKGPGGSKNTKD